MDHDCAVGDWAHLAPYTALAGNVSVGASTVIVRHWPVNITAVGTPARVISARNPA
jgi:serine acetyltransferase